MLLISKLKLPLESVKPSMWMRPLQLLWIAAGSVSGVPSSTTTFPERKNDRTVVSGTFGAADLPWLVPGFLPPPPCVCALSPRATARNRLGRTAILNMQTSHGQALNAEFIQRRAQKDPGLESKQVRFVTVTEH